MGFKAINKGKTLVQMVVDQILTHVVTGKVKPGDYLPVESRLAKSFNIGKSTIREALRILEARGIIEIVPRKGIRILKIPEGLLENGSIEFTLNLGPGHLSDLLDSLSPILASCAWLACQKRTSQDLENLHAGLEKIQRNVDQLQTASTSGKLQKRYEAEYLEFYSCMGQATHNILFRKFMGTLFKNLLAHLPLATVFFVKDMQEAQMLLRLDQQLVSAIDVQDCGNSLMLGLKKSQEISRIISSSLKL
jgi:GntR family transcriptional repressor for pyruvate dehydrogenase complex